MKRIIVIAGILVALAGGLFAMLPLLVSSDSVRSRILSQIQDLTGRTVTFRGNPTVSLKPFLGIEISDLIVADPLAGPDEPPLLSVELMQGRLNMLPALLGRTELEEFRLVRPRLNLKVAGDGTASWIFDSGQLHDALASLNAENDETDAIERKVVDFGKFEIVDGAINYENQISGQIESVTNIAGSFDWPNTTQGIEFDGNGIWRGERIEANARIEQPIILFAGGESKLTVAVKSTPLEFDFDGAANMLSDLQLTGKLDASSPSLGRLSEILNLDIGYFGRLDGLKAAGELSATASEMTLADAVITLSQNTAAGLIHFSRDEAGNLKLNGTLAFGDVDASGYFEEPGEDDQIVGSNLVPGIQLDLRLSADSLKAEGVTLQNLAAAITAHNNEWTFDIGDSQAFGGSVIARLGGKLENETRFLFLELSARGVDAAKVAELFPEGFISISGLADIDANLKSDGNSRATLVRQLNGEITTGFSDGQISGIDLLSLLQPQSPAQGSNIAQPLDGDGNTGFGQMNLKMFINRGIAWISKGLINTAEADFQIHGNADLYAGSLALRAQKIAENIPGKERLFIGGSFKTPLVTLEPGLPKNEPEQDSRATGETEISN